MLRPGDSLGDFEILTLLGEGAMGAVFRARQVSLDRLVALKVLHGVDVVDPAHSISTERQREVLARFQREAALQISLVHPHVVRVYDADVADGTAYLAMELMDGDTLASAIKAGESRPTDRLLGYARQLALALEYLHGGDVVHRDVKPMNVLRNLDGTLKLADFGLAKSLHGTMLTRTNQLVGTIRYMSPEAITGEDAGPPIDLYALGVVIFEMATGEAPFRGTDVRDLMRQIREQKAPDLSDKRPDLPPPLCTLVSRLMDRDRDRRPTATEVLSTLMSAIPAREPSSPGRPARPRFRGADRAKAEVPPRVSSGGRGRPRTALTPVGLFLFAFVAFGSGTWLVLRLHSGPPTIADHSTPAPLDSTGSPLRRAAMDRLCTLLLEREHSIHTFGPVEKSDPPSLANSFWNRWCELTVGKTLRPASRALAFLCPPPDQIVSVTIEGLDPLDRAAAPMTLNGHAIPAAGAPGSLSLPLPSLVSGLNVLVIDGVRPPSTAESAHAPRGPRLLISQTEDACRRRAPTLPPPPAAYARQYKEFLLLWSSGSQVQEGMDHARTMLALFPDEPAAIRTMGLVHTVLSRYRIELEAQQVDSLVLGYLLVNPASKTPTFELLAKGVAFLQRVLARNPRDAEAFSLLGLGLAVAGQYEMSQRAHGLACLQAPEQFSVWHLQNDTAAVHFVRARLVGSAAAILLDAARIAAQIAVTDKDERNIRQSRSALAEVERLAKLGPARPGKSHYPSVGTSPGVRQSDLDER